MQLYMSFVLLIASLIVAGLGIRNIRHNLNKEIPYDFWGDFQRTFLKVRMRYENTQQAHHCNLIMPGFQVLLGLTLLSISLFKISTY